MTYFGMTDLDIDYQLRRDAFYQGNAFYKSDAFLQSDANYKVAPFNRSDARDRCDTFGRCDAFCRLYRLSIPLLKLNLFVDCT